MHGRIDPLRGASADHVFRSPGRCHPGEYFLPAQLSSAPDAELGSSEGKQLRYAADGTENPFWPPATDDGSPEPPIGQYCASVFRGPGQGQTRRVIGRRGQTLLLERPWRVTPTTESLITVGTAFYRNLVFSNQAADGLSGIQLRISCIENIIANNTISRVRQQGILLFANLGTLASSMPRT